MVTQVQTRAVKPRWLSQSSLLYEDEYLLLAVICGLDVVVSYLHLHYGGNLFYNLLDDLLVQTWLWGLLAIKLVIFALVVMACETIGCRRPATGRKLINIINVLAALALGVVLYQFASLMIF